MTAATGTHEDREERLQARQQRLAGRARELDPRTSNNRDRALVVLGGTTIVLGVLALVLGWYGASDTHVVFEQIPYLISGGLFGLALVFIGTFTYFAYWLTSIVRETRELRRQLIAQQQNMLVQQQQIADALTALNTHLGATADDR